MAVQSHGELKYRASELLAAPVSLPSMHLELRKHSAGAQADLLLTSTEVVVLFQGRAVVRRTGDGVTQTGVAQPGTTSLCPAGVFERDVEIDAPFDECLHIYLPPTLLEESALEDYGFDPTKVRIAFDRCLPDETLFKIGGMLRRFVLADRQPTDRLFVDGIQATMAAHLIAQYSADTWHQRERSPQLPVVRLHRVLDYIEAHLEHEIDLQVLARECCLSRYHFARLFRESMGLPPHRYVMQRRIERAKSMLTADPSAISETALACGFGSQSNLTRVFRQATGITPGEYRARQRDSARFAKTTARIGDTAAIELV